MAIQIFNSYESWLKAVQDKGLQTYNFEIGGPREIDLILAIKEPKENFNDMDIYGQFCYRTKEKDVVEAVLFDEVMDYANWAQNWMAQELRSDFNEQYFRKVPRH